MKIKTVAALVATALAVAGICSVVPPAFGQAEAADPATKESYTVLSITPYLSYAGDRTDIDDDRLAAKLNELASEGWKVRTSVDSAIILAREPGKP